MSALPQISGREAVAVLRKFGYDVDRVVKGVSKHER